MHLLMRVRQLVRILPGSGSAPANPRGQRGFRSRWPRWTSRL